MSLPGEAHPDVARGFDRLAPFYDLLATLGSFGRIHASQVALLPRVRIADRALVVGGGSGRFLAALLGGDQARSAVSIDASREMTRRTRARLSRLGLLERAELRTGGLESLRADERFDLVATHCFLDLFDEAALRGVVARLSAALVPGGAWLFSDFSAGPSAPRRAIVAGLYGFFRLFGAVRVARLPDFAGAFREAGLVEVAERRFAFGLLRAALLLKPGAKGQPNVLSSAVGP